MKKLPVILALSLLSRTAHGEKVVSLQQMDLTDVPGKEGLMVTVEIAPGEGVPKHRHSSDVFVYVLSVNERDAGSGAVCKDTARRRDVC